MARFYKLDEPFVVKVGNLGGEMHVLTYTPEYPKPWSGYLLTEVGAVVGMAWDKEGCAYYLSGERRGPDKNLGMLPPIPKAALPQPRRGEVWERDEGGPGLIVTHAMESRDGSQRFGCLVDDNGALKVRYVPKAFLTRKWSAPLSMFTGLAEDIKRYAHND